MLKRESEVILVVVLRSQHLVARRCHVVSLSTARPAGATDTLTLVRTGTK